MKNLIMLLSVMFLSSCNSDDEKKNEFNYSTGFEMIVKNSEGIDLLNPNSPNTLNTNNIKLFYLKNGVSEEVYNPSLDLPRNYMIYLQSDGIYRIRIFPNEIQSEEFPISYIKWNETDIDTIKCKLKYTENAVVLEKVWFNEVFKLDTTLNNGLTFEILK